MELRQLTYFEAVARCGGFTRAADDLRIAQPAVSSQIRRLEHELGVTLLTRTSRHVALTEAGALFLTRTRRVLAELAAARDDMGEVASVVRGRVVVGATGVLGGLDLATLLAGFARRYPGVALSVRSGLMAALLPALADAEVDLVLGPIHADLPATFTADVLVDDRLVLVAPPGRLARGVTLADVTGEPFVCLPEGSGLRDLVDGLGCAVHIEAPTPQAVREMVGAGLGVALLAASAMDRPGTPVDVHEVVPAVPHPPFGIVRHAERAPGPAARALHEHVLAVAAVPGA